MGPLALSGAVGRLAAVAFQTGIVAAVSADDVRVFDVFCHVVVIWRKGRRARRREKE